MRVLAFAFIALVGCRTARPDPCQTFPEPTLGLPVDPNDLEDAGPRTFVGFVVDNDTGRALPEAEVLVYEGGRPTYAVTDAGGFFSMHALVVGAHSIAVRRYGFVTARSAVRISNTKSVSAIIRLERQKTGLCTVGM